MTVRRRDAPAVTTTARTPPASIAVDSIAGSEQGEILVADLHHVGAAQHGHATFAR